MIDSKDLKDGALIKYHFYKNLQILTGDSSNRMTRNYWGVGYIVKITSNYIKLSSLDPNREKIGIFFEFHKKVKLDDILEFTEIPEPEGKKDKI